MNDGEQPEDEIPDRAGDPDDARSEDFGDDTPAETDAPGEPADASPAEASAAEPQEVAPPLPKGPLREYPSLTFLLPLVVYMAVGSVEPAKPKPGDDPNEPTNWLHLDLEYERDYYKVYTLKIGLTLVSILLVVPGYRTFPFRVHRLAVIVGLGGGVVWILLCNLHLEQYVFDMLAAEKLVDLERRPAYNPFVYLADSTALAWGFMGVRLVGLVVIVALMEEFFLRGFVMRLCVDIDWWEQVPFGRVNDFAIIAGTLVPVLMHPATELIAVVVWFSTVTWLMLKTKSIWDCVVAHALTNLVIGLWVLLAWFLIDQEHALQNQWWLL